MSPRTRSHLRNGWDVSKWLVVIGTILTLAQQYVALKKDIRDQGSQAQLTAGSVVAMGGDVASLSKEVKRLEGRVSKLERPLPTRRSESPAKAAPDTVAARSPGPVQVLGMAAAAPFKALWGILKKIGE